MFTSIMEWIENNLNTQITGEKLEKISGYSRRHIHNLFIQNISMAPGEYIRLRRLIRASVLLRLSNKKVIDISALLHFESLPSFSREFKKLFGISPRRYRYELLWNIPYIPLSEATEKQLNLPTIELRNVPEHKYYGYNMIDYISLDNLPLNRKTERVDLIMHEMQEKQCDLTLITTYCPDPYSSFRLKLQSFIGFPAEARDDTFVPDELSVDDNLFACFFFCGTVAEYASLAWRLYHYVLPKYNLARQDNKTHPDIVHFRYDRCCTLLSCKYMIPVAYKI